MEYNVTDPVALQKILSRIMPHSATSGNDSIRLIPTVHRIKTGRPIVHTDRVAESPIIYRGSKTHLRLYLNEIRPGSQTYEVNAASFGPPVLKDLLQGSASHIRFSQPIDINSTIALYGKTPQMKTVLSAAEDRIRNMVGSTGLPSSGCQIRFFYNIISPLIGGLESSMKPFVMLDSLKNICFSGPNYYTPLPVTDERREPFFLAYNLAHIRSEILYPFTDYNSIPMGYIRLNSPWPLTGSEPYTYLLSLLRYLGEESLHILYELESTIQTSWKSLTSFARLFLVKGNQAILQLSIKQAPDLLRKGSRISFQGFIRKKARYYEGTVIAIEQSGNFLRVSIRIHTSDASIRTLSACS